MPERSETSRRTASDAGLRERDKSGREPKKGVLGHAIGMSRRPKCQPDASVTKHSSMPPAVQSAGAAKLHRLLGETVTSVVISSDAQLFAAGAMNKTAVVCEVQTGALVCELTAEAQITATVLGGVRQHSRLIIGTMTGRVTVYHVHSSREEHRDDQMADQGITSMVLVANSTRLAVGGKSSHVLLYALSLSEDTIGMNVLHRFDTQCTTTLSVSADHRCSQLVCGGESKVVTLWQMPSLEAFNGLSHQLHGAAANEASTPIEQRPLKFRTTSTAHSVALNAEGVYLAVGTSSATEIYTIQRIPVGGRVEVFAEPLLLLDVSATMGRVAFSSHAQLAIGGNQLVSVFDIMTGGMLVKMERHDRVRCVDIAQDGSCAPPCAA